MNPRDRDGSAPLDAADRDAGGVDAGAGDVCDPPCSGINVCRGGTCVPVGEDRDMDGVDASVDCNDDDASVGSTGERACSSACGTGVERCVDGVWMTCSAPVSCDCVEGSAPRTLDCGMCGQQRQVCTAGAWVDDGVCTSAGVCSPGEIGMGAPCGNCGRQERRCGADCQWSPFVCVDEGECAAGAVENDSRICTPSCGGTESRSRTCGSTCTWGAYSAFAGCVACGPTCGDGLCETGETCSTCADCQNGHLGAGDDGDPCSAAAEGAWRCVTRTSGGTVSQVCRSGAWVSFNLSPRDCSACVCGFSLACCQAGSPSGGC